MATHVFDNRDLSQGIFVICNRHIVLTLSGGAIMPGSPVSSETSRLMTPKLLVFVLRKTEQRGGGSLLSFSPQEISKF